jgi:hypothetical protein
MSTTILHFAWFFAKDEPSTFPDGSAEGFFVSGIIQPAPDGSIYLLPDKAHSKFLIVSVLNPLDDSAPEIAKPQT